MSAEMITVKQWKAIVGLASVIFSVVTWGVTRGIDEGRIANRMEFLEKFQSETKADTKDIRDDITSLKKDITSIQIGQAVQSAALSRIENELKK